MYAQGFAIKKVLKNGKLVNEEGIMGEFNNKEGARIIEVSDGKAKYTELKPNDILKLISEPAHTKSLEHRLATLVSKRHTKRRHHHRRKHYTHHHRRAHGHPTKHRRKRHRTKHRRKRHRRRRTKRR